MQKYLHRHNAQPNAASKKVIQRSIMKPGDMAPVLELSLSHQKVLKAIPSTTKRPKKKSNGE
jgi:hypothetical protein